MSSAVEIAYQIFHGDPKPANTISLGISEEMDLKEIFEMLLMIFTEGMKIHFGDEEDKVDLGALREKDFKKIQRYFQSFGFECKYRLYKPSEQRYIDFASRKYTNIDVTPQTKLDELILPLKCGPRVFEISFDFHRPSTTCHQQMRS